MFKHYFKKKKKNKPNQKKKRQTTGSAQVDSLVSPFHKGPFLTVFTQIKTVKTPDITFFCFSTKSPLVLIPRDTIKKVKTEHPSRKNQEDV